jgi:hypothetical protein
VREVEEALHHPTASVEVPLRAAEALAALRPIAGASSSAITEA